MEDLTVNKTKMPNRLRNFLSWFGYLMPFAYIALGLFFILSERAKENFIPTQRYAIGGLVIVYGLFRTFRIIKSKKDANKDEQSL
jgi:uncharacterized membrane protein